MLEFIGTSIATDTVYLIGKVVAILAATYLAAFIFDRFLERRFQRLTQQMEVSKTSYTLIRKLVTAGIYVIGVGIAVYTVPSLRQISVALMASAGFLGIVVGFAAQAALSNIISGVFIAMFKPFRVNDNLTTRDHYGSVEDITLRHTVIKTPANDRVIIPNASILNDYLINHSIHSEKSRYSLEIGIAYGSDIDTAREIMLDEAKKHDLVIDDEADVFVSELKDSSVVLKLHVWGKDRGDAWQATQDLRESIKKRFEEKGITIPFPQRTISYLEDGTRDESASNTNSPDG